MSDAPNLVHRMASDSTITDPDVERYSLLLAAQRSPRTVDAYRRDLAALAAFLGAPAAAATATSSRRGSRRCGPHGLAPSTIARRIAAARAAYFRHQQLLGARDDNPAAALDDAAPDAGSCRGRSRRRSRSA